MRLAPRLLRFLLVAHGVSARRRLHGAVGACGDCGLFSVSLVAPALVADSESQLPPCCRRLGKHHCTMQEQDRGGTSPTIRAVPKRCSAFPGTTVARSFRIAIRLAYDAKTSELATCALVVRIQPASLFVVWVGASSKGLGLLLLQRKRKLLRQLGRRGHFLRERQPPQQFERGEIVRCAGAPFSPLRGGRQAITNRISLLSLLAAGVLAAQEAPSPLPPRWKCILRSS